MCLCWNDDGSMCTDLSEINRRIKACMKGEFRPWVHESRVKAMEAQRQTVRERLTPERIEQLERDLARVILKRKP